MKIEAMEKAAHIMSEYTTNLHNVTNPTSSDYWLMHTIRNIFRKLLTNCFYGHCLIRILHMIHIMRYTYPQLPIIICKLDLEATYRRLHVLDVMAVLLFVYISQRNIHIQTYIHTQKHTRLYK